ncbi:hypothetical protein P691DRAFT_812788 [Macrolepiota fuliginosa MF-IS2]|uniref:Uncharacterized protein n=1 Tax=Macrolepiota fuliginosa MF-IS2 TaxID=1400762 RepID=A0A9P5WZX7_9AGAR|nr:hypothetical protein P691DRAFT_812788 [Macrolepiota fuliginosa MF-IS2]
MDGIPEPSALAPLHINYFYRQFISDIPPDIQPDALRILEALGSARTLRNAHDVAHLLGIDQSRFYCVLEHFHSVLKIPPPKLPDGRIEDHSIEPWTFLDFLYWEYRQSPITLQSEIRWTPSQPIDHFHRVAALRTFTRLFTHSVQLINALSDLPAVVYDHIRDFDFRYLVEGPRANPSRCHIVLQWLFSHRAHLPDLVRTDAKSAFDHQLIEKCTNFTRPIKLHGLDHFNLQPFPVRPPRYALLSHGAQTVLIILCEDSDDVWGEYTFYSLEMLDDI